MIHILLFILKIIGILLLALLALLILFLCILLIAPICYQVNITGEDTMESIKADIQISWLFHLCSGWFCFVNKQTKWGIRLLFKKFPNTEKIQKKKNIKKPTKHSIKPSIRSSTKESTISDDLSGHNQTAVKQLPVHKPEVDINTTTSKESIFQKIKKWFENIKCTMIRIYDNIKRMLRNKDMLVVFLHTKVHKAAFTKGKKEVFRLLNYLKPRKILMKILFGFDDPAATGQVLAIFSMLYPWMGKNADITPDFEHSVFKGSIRIKGKLRIIYFIITATCLVLNKQVRTTIKDIRNFKFE